VRRRETAERACGSSLLQSVAERGEARRVWVLRDGACDVRGARRRRGRWERRCVRPVIVIESNHPAAATPGRCLATPPSSRRQPLAPLPLPAKRTGRGKVRGAGRRSSVFRIGPRSSAGATRSSRSSAATPTRRRHAAARLGRGSVRTAVLRPLPPPIWPMRRFSKADAAPARRFRRPGVGGRRQAT